MRCPKCGADNREVRKFCAKCAAPLARSCPHCGASNELGEDFCGECSTALGVSATAASAKKSSDTEIRLADVSAPENLEGERKTVTVLFADIKGSMELIEDLDPEDARAIVDPALRLMMDAVHHYEGYVSQSTGDGIFALFGAPVAHEYHSQRALYAALRMRDDLKRYSDRIGADGSPPIQARVGVNTGEVVVRSISTGDGRTEYAPVGHSTGIAARMQVLAPVGSIAATEQVRKLCEGYFLFKPLGPTKVKGVSEPVNVYEVTGLGPLRTRLQRSAARGYTKFVGREREMDALKHAAERARAGRGQIVAAVAEPGVGKSRLFDEFKTRDRSGWMVLEALSVPHGKASAFLPVIGLLWGYFKITADDDAHSRREKINDKVLTLDRALEDALPFVYSLLGLNEPNSPAAEVESQTRKLRSMDAIKRILLRESLNQPLMVIFEDLQGIDRETQAFLDLLVDSIGTSKILMLVNYRHEYSHQWNSKTYYAQLRLDPLAGESAEAMLSALLGEGEDLVRLKRLIVEKTEGNPLFMEEIYQALIEDGSLVRDGAAVKLAKSLNHLKIPSTVQGILDSRIDRLPPGEKDLLQMLAVMGKEFPLKLVREVIQKPDDELNRILNNLQFAEFIYEQPAAGNIEYTFKHALTREAAYNSVIVERRLLLHERIGAALESLYSGSLDDHLAELAHHYRTAGKAADPEKAIDYSIRAGRAAYAGFAYEEAGTHWRAALGLMPEGGEDRERRADLLERLGELLGMNALMNAPDTGEYVHYLEQARKLYEDLGQLEAAARVHSRLAAWELVRHKVDMSRVLEHNRRAQDFLSDTPEGLSAVLLYVGLGVTALEGMRYDEALTATRRAMDLSERLGDEIYWARAGVVHALAHCFRGRMAEGFALLSRIRAKADQLDDLLTAVSAISAAEYTHIFLLNPFEVAARVEQELAKPRTSKAVLLQKALIHLIGLSRLLMGKVTEVGALVEQAQGAPLSDGPHLEARFSFYLGDWRRAELILEQAMNEELQADRLLRFCICGQLAARILRSQGRTAEAESILQKTLAICVTSSATLIELAVQQELALVCTDTGRLEQARLHIERCREIQSNGEDWRGLATNTMRAEAVLATAETRLEDAQGQFAKAVEVYRHYLLPFEEAETMHWWGRAVLAAGEPVRAVEKFDAAIEIYRSRGAGARFIEYVMEDKRRAQRSNSTHAEVQSPTDSTQAVPRRVTQERPNLVAHPPSNASGSRKLGPG